MCGPGPSGIVVRSGSELLRARIPRRLVPVFVVVAAGALVVRLDGRRVGVALLKLADPSVAECWNRDRDARRARGQPALGGRELATRSSHQLASSSCETPCCDTGRASRLLLRPEACRQEAPRRGARQQLIPSKMDERNELPRSRSTGTATGLEQHRTLDSSLLRPHRQNGHVVHTASAALACWYLARYLLHAARHDRRRE